MRFTYVCCSGQGLRFDIYDGNVRIAISHDETHAKMIVKLLNSKAKPNTTGIKYVCESVFDDRTALSSGVIND